MGLKIEQACPQCGARLELDETDHILQCPYCDVKSIISSPNYFRYILPDNAPDRELLYAPYLRFKGVVYFCRDMTLDYHIVDITHIGIGFKHIPVSLGIRPQAMKLRFLTPGRKRAFLKFSLKAVNILTRAAEISSGSLKKGILHRAFIGETMSIIYLPLYMDNNMLFDGILNRPVASLTKGPVELESMIVKNPGWSPRFIPALCPHCGWMLEGKKDSVALLCRNCHRVWEIQEDGLKELDLLIVQGRNPRSIYIPFWRITAKCRGVDIDTFSDFIRLTNQPIIADEERGKKAMNFFCPAFKIRPKLFLNLSRQFTISQWDFKGEESFHEMDLYPVTMPRTEAIQALKIILAGSCVNKKNIFPNLPRINFEIKGVTLVFLPFIEGPNDMIHEDTGIAINRPSLEFGRRM